MGSDLYVAANGAIARMRDLDVVANNLANAETTGFKRDRTVFHAAFEGALRAPDGRDVPGAAGRVYVGAGGLAPDLAAGPVERTGAPLDVALSGPGFFQVETPAGPRYTRSGSFVVGENGTLTTPEGFAVEASSGRLRVRAGAARFDESGSLVDERGRELGRLRVVDFARPDLLVKEGRNLFRAPEDLPPERVRDPRLAAGSLEASNVVAVEELARLVVLQRAFDAAMQSLTLRDQSTERLLREVRS